MQVDPSGFPRHPEPTVQLGPPDNAPLFLVMVGGGVRLWSIPAVASTLPLGFAHRKESFGAEGAMLYFGFAETS